MFLEIPRGKAEVRLWNTHSSLLFVPFHQAEKRAVLERAVIPETFKKQHEPLVKRDDAAYDAVMRAFNKKGTSSGWTQPRYSYMGSSKSDAELHHAEAEAIFALGQQFPPWIPKQKKKRSGSDKKDGGNEEDVDEEEEEADAAQLADEIVQEQAEEEVADAAKGKKKRAKKQPRTDEEKYEIGRLIPLLKTLVKRREEINDVRAGRRQTLQEEQEDAQEPSSLLGDDKDTRSKARIGNRKKVYRRQLADGTTSATFPTRSLRIPSLVPQTHLPTHFQYHAASTICGMLCKLVFFFLISFCGICLADRLFIRLPSLEPAVS